MSATSIYNSPPEPELVLTARRSGYSRWSWPSRTSTCRTANLHCEKNTQISRWTQYEIDVPRPEAGLLERPAPSHSLNGGVPAHNRPEKKRKDWMMLPSFWNWLYRNIFRSPADLLNVQLSLQQTRFLGTAAVQLRQKSHHPPANQAPDMVQQIQEYDVVCDGMW